MIVCKFNLSIGIDVRTDQIDLSVVTLGLYRNRSVERIKGNQATFDNSQRNNLRSCVWVFGGSVGEDVRADVSFSQGEKSWYICQDPALTTPCCSTGNVGSVSSGQARSHTSGILIRRS